MTLCLDRLAVKQDEIANEFLASPQKQLKRMFFYGLDLKQDHLFHVSDAIEDVLGYSSKDVAQRGIKWFVEQIHQDDLKPLNHAADQHSQPAILPRRHYRFRTKTRGFRLVCEHRHLLYDSKGVPSFLIGRIETL
jgi:PAS domain-containing protein